MKRKRVVVLGATGSIGESALKVAHDIPERMEIVGLAANRNAQKLAAQANKVRPPAVCLVDETKVGELRAALEYEPRIFSGESGLVKIACSAEAEMVLVAVVGIAVRLYVLTALAFDYRGLGEDFHRMFLLFLIVDDVWALSPLLVAYKIGMGLAIAATVALAFLPFSQRTLMRMGYRSQT